jgi:IMP cyclohydrolase
MYVGRIVAVGKNAAGANAVMYRVSSRSFPNRQAVDNNGTLAVVPRPGFETDLNKNPYIAYNALRLAGDWAIATNGSHTDPIVEKVALGMPMREAMTLSLLALDYEKDDFNTPRIAAAVPRNGDTGWLAIVRKDALVVKEVVLQAGQAQYIATYEMDDIRSDQVSTFDANTAAGAAEFAVSGGAFADLEKPVTSAAALTNNAGFALGTFIVEV